MLIDAEELASLRQAIAEGQAAMPVLEALWTRLLEDPELRRCLDAIAGGRLLDALSIAKRALMGTLARRRCELESLRGGGGRR